MSAGLHHQNELETQQQIIEALQAAYPHLTEPQLEILCIATGISPEIAFPWHNMEIH